MSLEVEGAEIQQHGSLPCLAAKHCEALKLFVSRHLQDTAEAKFCEAKAAATLALLSQDVLGEMLAAMVACESSRCFSSSCQ